MVDRIVPSAVAGFLDDTEARLGLRDEAAVATEPFRQWVIEDRFAGPRPAWEAGGAEFVADVGAYETRKLRLLNGAHSALAYLGLERGHRFVHEAIRDPSIRPLVERLMREEAAPTLPRESARDAPRYANELLQRFENPALEHRLAQIAMDGSQKIPQRWLATLEAQRLRGQACPATLAALAAWIVHVRGKAGVVIDDPSAAELGALWRHAGAHGIVAALFGSAAWFGAAWTPTDADRKSLTEAIARQ
jgi:fructuronate reductase